MPMISPDGEDLTGKVERILQRSGGGNQATSDNGVRLTQADNPSAKGSSVEEEFRALPTTAKENEEEIARRKQELTTATGQRASNLRSRIAALEKNRYAFSSHGAPPRDETLPEAEDRLLGEISQLEQQLAKTSDPKERNQIAEAIEGRKAGLSAVIAEKDAGRSSPPRKTITLLDFRSDFVLDQPTQVILDFIQNDLLKVFSQPYPEITPHLFFYAAILRTAIGPNFHPDADALGRLVQKSADEVRAHIGSELSRQPAEKRNFSLVLSSEMMEVVERAISLALETTGEKTILLRHLLVAALTFRNPLEYLFFTRLGIEAKQVVYGFLDYLRNGYPGDDAQAWTNAFRNTARLAGINLSLSESGPSPERGEGAEDDGDDDDFAPVVFKLTNKYLIEPQVVQLIQHTLDLPAASRFGHFLAQITPAGFLLGAIQAGRTNPGFHKDCDFVASEFSRRASLTDESFSELLLDELLREAKSKPGTKIEQFPAIMDEVLSFAQELATSTTGDRTILMRHVVGTICLLAPGWDEQVKGRLLQNYHLDINELGPRLLRHILGTYPTDKGIIWRSEFQKAFTLDQDLRVTPEPTGGVEKSPERESETKETAMGGSSIQIGSKDAWEREATEAEAALKVDDYATALRDVYTKAGSGEFSFALFGPWGRGKTFLINRLAHLLKADKYETVFFSAWKYPTTPEVWVHLYEKIADKACTGSFWAVLPRIIRTGIARNGAWQLIGAFALIAFAVTPKFWLAKLVAEVAVKYVRWVGIGGLVWLFLLTLGIRRTKAKLTQNYIAATRHTEKLGLQATIGRDLKALIDGWMPVEKDVNRLALVAYFGVSLWLAWSAWHWFRLDFGRTSGFPSSWAAAVGVIIITGLLLLWVRIPVAKPSRVLLVIDDLDRCSTSQLLHVVESVKLLTEEPAISQRIQVAALVDEDLLDHAILTKHADLKESHCFSKFGTLRLIRENREKLFTAHLRLPSLDQTELAEVLDLVIARERKVDEENNKSKRRNAIQSAEESLRRAKDAANERTKVVAAGPVVKPQPHVPDGHLETKEVPLTSQETEERLRAVRRAEMHLESIMAASAEGHPSEEAASVTKKTPEVNVLKVQFRFSEDEEKALHSAVAQLSRLSHSGPWGPRSVRSFVFRYQLARMLVVRLYLDSWTPQLLCDLLVEQLGPNQSRSVSEAHPRLARIVSQVA